MNIDRVNQNLASGAYGRKTNRAGDVRNADASSADGARAAGAQGGVDGITLSDEARAIARAEAAVRAAPDVREELVSELNAQVKNGTYRLNDAAVARELS